MRLILQNVKGVNQSNSKKDKSTEGFINTNI